MNLRTAAALLLLAVSAARADERDVDIPSSDVNFGNKASIPGETPPTGALLHRKFAEKWRHDAQASFGRAEAAIAFALSGRCGGQPKALAPGWKEVLASARAEAARGEAMWETVPQISARHYMRATKMSDNLVAGAAAANCRPPK